MYFIKRIYILYKEDSLPGRIIFRFSFKDVRIKSCSNKNVFWKEIFLKMLRKNSFFNFKLLVFSLQFYKNKALLWVYSKDPIKILKLSLLSASPPQLLLNIHMCNLVDENLLLSLFY